MTYGYQGFWSEIQPMFADEERTRVLYWHYAVFKMKSNKVIFDGYRSDSASAWKAAEAHIENLVRDSASTSKAA
jgi:hypothetical protein